MLTRPRGAKRGARVLPIQKAEHVPKARCMAWEVARVTSRGPSVAVQCYSSVLFLLFPLYSYVPGSVVSGGAYESGLPEVTY